jgi:hypothetical protein
MNKETTKKIHKQWRTPELAYTDGINVAVSAANYDSESSNIKAEDPQRIEDKGVSRCDWWNHAPTQFILRSAKQNIPSLWNLVAAACKKYF